MKNGMLDDGALWILILILERIKEGPNDTAGLKR